MCKGRQKKVERQARKDTNKGRQRKVESQAKKGTKAGQEIHEARQKNTQR